MAMNWWAYKFSSKNFGVLSIDLAVWGVPYQRKEPDNPIGEASPATAAEHLKSMTGLVKDNKWRAFRISDGEYRVLYVERKQYEYDREPNMPPFIAHYRAGRFMFKRFLLELWREWRAVAKV